MKLGISRNELAHEIDVTPNMITQIETARAKPSWEKATKMFNYFKRRAGIIPGTVEEVYTKKAFTLRPSDKVGVAEKQMIDNDWDCIPVVDNEGKGKLHGKITTVIIKSISNKNNYKEIPIREVMSEPPPTVPYCTPIKWIIRFLTPPDCVLVTKKGNDFFGIVDLWDAVEKRSGL